MRKFLVNILILTLGIYLNLGQVGFCAENDTAQSMLQKIKSSKIFSKNKDNSNKTFEFTETELDTSPSSMFQDEDIETTGITQRKNFFNFDRRRKNRSDDVDLEEESVNETNAQQESQKNENHTYINDDTELVYIKEVEIFGNNLLDVNYIKEQIKSKEGYQYVRGDVSNDLRNLYNTGYFTQNLRALPIKIDDTNVKLRIILEENPPVAGFGIVGNNSLATEEIMEILKDYEGKPQNIVSLNSAINQIQELYASKGYILARVSKVQDDPDGYINLSIDEGIIGDIVIDGNNKTKDFIVKRNIFLQPGSVYNENVMRSDILRLMGTQAFKDVQRELKKDEQTGLYDVYVALEEQRTGKISLGVGIDSSSGFFGSVGFSENNFRGLGQKLGINLLAGTGVLMNDTSVVQKANLQGEISFLEPQFKRENQSLSIRGFGRYYGSYQVPVAVEKRFGAEATVARRFLAYKNLSGSIGFGFENVDLSEGDEGKIKAKFAQANVPWSRRAEELDGGFFVKVTPALTYDTRDSSLNARHGVMARVMLEENLGLGANTFGKLHGTIKKFAPVGKKSSIVLTAKAGGKLHGDIPEFANYALGGPYTIRGFNISEVGVGSGYMMGSAEYRVPIPFIDRLTSNSFLNNLRIAFFVDAGKLFDRSLGSIVYDKPGYAISAGVGLRVFIPGLGPISLDYGMPLTNTGSVDRKSGFFTFGMGEMF